MKSAAKNKTQTTLRIIKIKQNKKKQKKKKIQDKELPHELLLTTRQKTKIKNAFANNISTDIRISKAQLPRII